MKKLVMVLTLLPLMAAAETEIVNGIKWTYTVRDGKAEIGDGFLPAIPSATTGALTIPSTLGGHPVTGIGDYAFAWCSGLTSVTIPEGVTSIGGCVLEDCDGLKSVTIPSSVTSIAESAFFCHMLSSIIVKAGNRAYKIVNGCLLTWDGTVLIRGPSKDVVVVPEGVRVIASCAFFRCNLKSVSIPASVETIMCHDPRILPEGGRAFDSCPQLASIRVDPANSFYKSENNCLLTKDGKVLLRGPSVVSATIPEGVEVIADEAFQDCEALVSVTIPSTVVRIGDWAFWWCKALSSLTIPASVQEVEPGFAECASLRFVRFLGAPPEFKWFEYDAEELALPIRYNSEYAEAWARVIEHYGFTDAEPYGGVFELVSGEKADFDTGLIGYAASGLPSGLKYNKKTGKITGAAKKPTAAEGVTVKFTKKDEPDAERTIVVGPMPKLSIALEGDTEKCKVKGAGAYFVGKKVSLSVTAPKGTAFMGWFANGALWPNAEDCQKAKLSYVMTKADVSLVAKFEKEKMSVGCAGLEGRSFTVGVAGGAGIPLEIETQSGVKSVKVSKLPAGMKYNAKTGLIEGAPTKAGDFTVQIAVTAKSGAVKKKDIAIHVDPLPDWAVGTFSGMIGRRLESSGEDGAAFYGSLQFTVKATGAVSAKVTAGGKTYSFSAKGFGGVEDGEAFLSYVHYPDMDEVACRVSDTLVLDLTSKKGDALLLGVTLFQKSGHLCVAKVGGTFVRGGCANPYGLVAWRNEAGKDSRIAPGTPAAEAVARLKNLGKVYLKARELEPRADGARHFALDWRGGEPLHRYGSKESDVTLFVDKSGNVKVSGKIDGVKLTASTPLRIGGNEWFAVTADSIAYDKKSGMDYEFMLGWDTINPHTGVISVTPDPNADPLAAGQDMHGFELRIEPFE